MTDKLITYEDHPDESGYRRKLNTREMRSASAVVNRADIPVADRLAQIGREPEPLACPYGKCENVHVIESGKYVTRPIGYLKADGSGRVRRCQCLLDRIERAKPLESAKPSTPGKLFSREPITDDPESEREL